MDDFNAIDLKKIITDSTLSLFSTMFSMNLVTPAESQVPNLDSYNFIGWVEIRGELISGFLEIGLTKDLGQIISSRMLCTPVEQLYSTEEILDVLKESSNIIGGNLKSRLCDIGYTCKISTPTVVDSTAYQMNPTIWTRKESYIFQYEHHYFFVRGNFKQGPM